jgi:membrane fusion protein, heavy metal efflux system
MKRTSIRIVLAAFLLVACPKKPAPEADDTHAQEKTPDKAAEETHDHEALPKRVHLTPSVIQDARLETTTVTREALVVTVALPGEVAADPDLSAHVSSPIAGRIERVNFREGSVVQKGETLAVIRVPDLGKLRATLAATLAKAKAARASANRLKDLMQQRLTSEQSYLDAIAHADVLDVEAIAASEQISALGMTSGGHPSQLILRAPTAGTVVVRKAVVGQPVTADEVIAEIVDLTELWFLGRVFEKDLGRLELGANVEVELNAYPKERFSGAVEYIGQQVDPVARTVTARIRLKNRNNLLRVGLFGSAYASTNEERSREMRLVVPRSALTEVAGKPVVFVKHKDDDYELHELTLGEAAGGKVQVIAGLHEGEQVVTEGVFTLKSAVLKTTFAEEEE